ncbi:molybdenum ABC transporter permease [Bacillus sp. JCM 19034]|uniref:molybdate ABC transporter permease subunit n=1 Tax=Bacillus sp. JCM 19034 TaxID=1481928 RepID=UPI000AD2BF48|nr:ABC transporter permease subunit [Bacillus sp. JCM 19034]
MNTMITPLLLSLKIATIATFIAFLLGILLSWWFAYRKNKWTELLSIVITIPLVIPPTVLGYYLLVILGRNSVIGQVFEQLFGQPIVFTWKAAVIAAAISALPLLIRPIQASFEGVSRDMRGAAQLDGANRLQLFWYLILPLSYRGVLAGVVLASPEQWGNLVRH